MEDRFRFRAWDSRLKEYAYDIQNISMCDRDEDFITFFRYVERDKTDVTLEQCADLKDKNGKLIYEGDIVRVDSKVYYIDPLTLVVGFHNGAFMVGDRFIDNNSKFMEIIGNIHENPELLEEE